METQLAFKSISNFGHSTKGGNVKEPMSNAFLKQMENFTCREDVLVSEGKIISSHPPSMVGLIYSRAQIGLPLKSIWGGWVWGSNAFLCLCE